MSADNYTLVKKVGDKYELYIGCASNDYLNKVKDYPTLEEAIINAPGTEYGMTFDLDGDDDDPTTH